MGGSGSGRRGGLGSLTSKTNEYRSIDIDWLRRERMLRPGRSGKLYWARKGVQVADINYRVEAGGFRLIYRTKTTGGEWRDVNEIIPIEETSTNFSGRRSWFVCLTCERRCRILYGGSLFRCRQCHDLKFDSQYEDPLSRLLNRAFRIRARLGGQGGLDKPFPRKPKHMHWHTYNRLKSADERLQNAWAIGVARKLHLLGH